MTGHRTTASPIGAAAAVRVKSLSVVQERPPGLPLRPPPNFDAWLEGYFLGNHPLIRSVRAKVSRAAREDRPVLLTGETGTGKDMLAQAIHLGSARSWKAPQVVAVAGLGDTAWSVLFGHRKGAFTGAEGDHQGIFKVSDGSTLILEDISDLPLKVQPMLLRAIEHGVFRPLGLEQEIRSNARIVSTTNLPLEPEVTRGRFRADLFQRLSVLRISIPPLREHPEDIALYASHFLLKASAHHRPTKRLRPDALKVLMRHSWPRNLREMEHLLYHASVEGEGPEISAADLERALETESEFPPTSQGPRPQPSRVLDRAAVVQALDQNKGNKRRAAKTLKISPGTLYSLMKRHRIFG